MRGAVRAAIGCLDRVLGPVTIALQRHRGSGIILLYHRVSPEPDPAFPPLLPEVFAEHCQLIRRYFTVIPLSEFVRRREAGRPLRGCCAITFDDGYRDVLDHAYPVLRREGMPSTQFIATDCMRDNRPTWNLRLDRLMHHLRSEGRAAELPRPAGEMKEYLGALPAGERYAWLKEREASEKLPAEPPMIRPEDARAHGGDLLEWGSHTVTHAMLGLCEPGAIRKELEESRGRLSEMVGTDVALVSYPNNSYTPAVTDAARAAGYRSGFAVDQRAVSADASAYALPRFDIGHMPRSMLRLELGGGLEWARRVVTRSAA